MARLDALPKINFKSTGVEHERLLALINNMAEGVLALDQSARIILSNSVALNLLDKNAIEGQYLQDAMQLIDQDGQPVNAQEAVLSSQAAFTSREWRIAYHDGSKANLFISVSPVRYGFGSQNRGGWVMLMRDITAEKTLEEERDEFISVTSHELRTPVAVMEGNISNSLLLARRANSPAELSHALTAAHDQVIFLSNLINDLAKLSRADRGNLSSGIENFKVNELITSLANDYRPEAKQKGLNLAIQPDSHDTSLLSSRLYVREMLQNLVINALKYSEKGQITIGVASNGDGVQFMVKDEGIGISRSEQNKLFSKFFRSSDWRVKKVNGTGLGLYVTAKLAHLLDGHLDVESELNHGSTFRVFVPNIKAASKTA